MTFQTSNFPMNPPPASRCSAAGRVRLVWPILYPVALSFGYSDPLSPVYWLMPAMNSGAVGLLAAAVHRWRRHGSRSWPRYRSDSSTVRLRSSRLKLPQRCSAAEHGTFARYLRAVKSDKDACTILQERFRHVGSYTAEFYLHCVRRSVYGP